MKKCKTHKNPCESHVNSNALLPSQWRVPNYLVGQWMKRTSLSLQWLLADNLEGVQRSEWYFPVPIHLLRRTRFLSAFYL